MTKDTVPPPDGLVGRNYPGHCYKRLLPPAPPMPPPVRWFLNEKEIPPPHLRKKKEKFSVKERFKIFMGWVVLSICVVLFSWALAKGMELQARDVSAWAKDYDYRHCWGKFDTPACHARKAKENAEAYREYGGGK